MPNQYTNHSHGVELGQRFGRLVTVTIGERDSHRNLLALCRCDCGNMRYVWVGKLVRGHTTSCGCGKRDRARSVGRAQALLNVTHGMTHHPIYDVYGNMMQRCHNPKYKRFQDYGGRGIVVCDEWRSDPSAFLRWALASGYQPGLSIERINNDGSYEPANCRWATQAEQMRNTRRNRLLTWQGETLNATDWAKRLGVNPIALHSRLARGWSVERIFTEEFRRYRRRQ